MHQLLRLILYVGLLQDELLVDKYSTKLSVLSFFLCFVSHCRPFSSLCETHLLTKDPRVLSHTLTFGLVLCAMATLLGTLSHHSIFIPTM